MHQDITDFLTQNMTPVSATHITAILNSLEKVYLDYDETLLLDQVDGGNGGKYEADETADILYSIITAEARAVLAVHGIAVDDKASLNSLDGLLQVLVNVTTVEDTEDVLALLNTLDPTEALCELIPLLADTADDCGFNPIAIQGDILHVDNVLIERIQHLLMTGEPAEIPLTPQQRQFTLLFPGNVISEMLAPPAMLYTNGDLQMYTSIFTDRLAEETPLDILTTCLGAIVVSNLPVTAYRDTLFDMLSTYLEPEQQVIITRQATKFLNLIEQNT